MYLTNAKDIGVLYIIFAIVLVIMELVGITIGYMRIRTISIFIILAILIMLTEKGRKGVSIIRTRVKEWRERINRSKLGDIIIRNDEGVVPMWWRNWKERYGIGLGKLMTINGLSIIFTKMMVKYGFLGGKLDWVLGIILLVVIYYNMIYILDFLISIVYLTYKDLIKFVYNIRGRWGKKRKSEGKVKDDDGKQF